MFDVEQQGESARLTSEHDQETHFRCFNGFRPRHHNCHPSRVRLVGEVRSASEAAGDGDVLRSPFIDLNQLAVATDPGNKVAVHGNRR
jgi:hypothetical protein